MRISDDSHEQHRSRVGHDWLDGGRVGSDKAGDGWVDFKEIASSSSRAARCFRERRGCGIPAPAIAFKVSRLSSLAPVSPCARCLLSVHCFGRQSVGGLSAWGLISGSFLPGSPDDINCLRKWWLQVLKLCGWPFEQTWAFGESSRHLHCGLEFANAAERGRARKMSKGNQRE